MQKPNITISSIDAERLDRLIDTLDEKSYPNLDDLIVELSRANIVLSEQVPANVVTMNSTIVFTVASTEKEFSLTLVYPKDLANKGNNISILAPVGSALLGLSEGDEISWPKPGGGDLLVKVTKVTYQPERSGHFEL
ncbi:nucleoside diphosphate kinase regulator [Colwellia sp. UCD-KL20]|uniref:nucleoside diphosphate kinase regulator n=1 Tax=Colwellia sp. UCD-KL20 TaxID=1917165 RepID=UPI0009707B03|nr:nucleoside diphosphate kinase regulator [Colwellia sp. UCD-KL20]